jgi:hypothetical protein
MVLLYASHLPSDIGLAGIPPALVPERKGSDMIPVRIEGRFYVLADSGMWGLNRKEGIQA